MKNALSEFFAHYPMPQDCIRTLEAALDALLSRPAAGSFNTAWKNWLMSGGKSGGALGILLWDAEKNAPRPRLTSG